LPHSRDSLYTVPLIPTAAYGLRVDSDQPIVAERAVYFDNGRAGYDSAAVAAPATEWFLPEGGTGGSFEEQLAVLNPQNQAVNVQVEYRPEEGDAPPPQRLGIGATADKRLMRELRAEADVVLHGAGTVRADPLSARVPPDLVEQRLARGLSRQPLGAIVTRSGDLPVRHPYYESSSVIYVTSSAAVAVELPTVEVCRVSTVVEVLQDLARRGARRVICEGGPTLNSALFANGLVD